ncbi:hypothetical protein LUZ60_005747 [Juncus effusus]|nr:hypothetical protein LUZ60_005747 [Juncus effusus]
MGKSKGRKKNGDGKRKKNKKSSTVGETLAFNYVHDWISPPSTSAGGGSGDDFLPSSFAPPLEPLTFDLHSHSNHSDGFLSPSALILRAHKRGVKVLALTDHDTTNGIPEAVNAASKFGMRIIPGVEISALFSPKVGTGSGEIVHILAYYSPLGPSSPSELESMLLSIRQGRYTRAKNILQKLQRLKLPVKWENLTRIAGEGIAPGRLHVARAMVEAGHVDSIKNAFNKYLYDDGPAYSLGSEPSAETVVELIKKTGGVSALAHPWSIKNPISVIKTLANHGLNCLEVYRSDGKVNGFAELADLNGLIKIGGSDFHGKGEKDESELGSVNLSINTLYNFLKMARPIWCESLKNIFEDLINEPTEHNLKHLLMFGYGENVGDFVDRCVGWLSEEEREGIDFEGMRERMKDEVFGR